MLSLQVQEITEPGRYAEAFRLENPGAYQAIKSGTTVGESRDSVVAAALSETFPLVAAFIRSGGTSTPAVSTSPASTGAPLAVNNDYANQCRERHNAPKTGNGTTTVAASTTTGPRTFTESIQMQLDRLNGGQANTTITVLAGRTYVSNHDTIVAGLDAQLAKLRAIDPTATVSTPMVVSLETLAAPKPLLETPAGYLREHEVYGRLGMNPSAFRDFKRMGCISPAKTIGGNALYLESDVQRVAAGRKN
jgi:hypothetical protein